MTDIIFILVCALILAVVGFVAFELAMALGSWFLNVIALSN